MNLLFRLILLLNMLLLGSGYSAHAGIYNKAGRQQQAAQAKKQAAKGYYALPHSEALTLTYSLPEADKALNELYAIETEDEDNEPSVTKKAVRGHHLSLYARYPGYGYTLAQRPPPGRHLLLASSSRHILFCVFRI